MKFLYLGAIAAFLPAIQCATNFKASVNTANRQMSTLSRSIDEIQSVANRLGHTQVSAKAAEAKAHLNFAQSSWGGISSIFGNNPWLAALSPQGKQCKSRLSSCGSALNWIYRHPQVSGCRDYQPYISSCRSGYSGCQSTCGQIWNWPCPSGWKPPPNPSQWYRRERRTVDTPNLCPPTEIACPISANTTGHECIDTQTEITSCGGCESLNEGENCLAIEGADEVGCESGHCRVFSTLPGYVLNEDNGRPEPIPQ